MISCAKSALEENQLENTGWHRHFSTSGASRFGSEFGISKLGLNAGPHTSPSGRIWSYSDGRGSVRNEGEQKNILLRQKQMHQHTVDRHTAARPEGGRRACRKIQRLIAATA